VTCTATELAVDAIAVAEGSLKRVGEGVVGGHSLVPRRAGKGADCAPRAPVTRALAEMRYSRRRFDRTNGAIGATVTSAIRLNSF